MCAFFVSTETKKNRLNICTEIPTTSAYALYFLNSNISIKNPELHSDDSPDVGKQISRSKNIHLSMDVSIDYLSFLKVRHLYLSDIFKVFSKKR